MCALSVETHKENCGNVVNKRRVSIKNIDVGENTCGNAVANEQFVNSKVPLFVDKKPLDAYCRENHAFTPYMYI